MHIIICKQQEGISATHRVGQEVCKRIYLKINVTKTEIMKLTNEPERNKMKKGTQRETNEIHGGNNRQNWQDRPQGSK